VPEDSPLVGRTIGSVHVRSRTGASIVAVMRNGVLLPNPDAGYQFGAGDMVGILGNQQQRATFAEIVEQANGSDLS
jgi:monovalent cation:H+ antiporter-2, CPA2 family